VILQAGIIGTLSQLSRCHTCYDDSSFLSGVVLCVIHLSGESNWNEDSFFTLHEICMIHFIPLFFMLCVLHT